MNFAGLITIVILIVGLGLPGAAPSADDDDQGVARRLVSEGAILPLEEVLDSLRAPYPGRVLEVDLEEEHGNWIYEIELLDPSGTVWELEVDATNGTVLERERDD
jgi:uncharacterized membrane protein YkoI